MTKERSDEGAGLDRGVVLLSKIDPTPPRGIKYMLGDEAWLPKEDRTPRRLLCEEWGNLGPLELDPDIPMNKIGLRVRHTEIIAPHGATGFAIVDGEYFWVDAP